jgi:hypothetical protein
MEAANHFPRICCAMKTNHDLEARQGFTTSETAVVAGIAALLVVIAVTHSKLVRDTSRLNVVKRSLRENGGTKQQPVLQNDWPESVALAGPSDFSKPLQRATFHDPFCEPYVLLSAGTSPTTFSVFGADSQPTRSTGMIESPR